MTTTETAQPRDPSFFLISSTELPLETLAAVWINSRPTLYKPFLDFLEENEGRRTPTARDIARYLDTEHLPMTMVIELLQTVATMSIPVSECISFTWGWESMAVAYREQAVRKRTVGFWITSAREFGMQDFVDQGRFTIPPSLEDLDDEKSTRGIAIFMALYEHAQEAYRQLIDPEIVGITQEDARLVIPSGACHNGTMFTNLRTLMEMTSSRSCWIAQVDLWAPVLRAISNELRALHPMLGIVITPPCFKPGGNEYLGCKYKKINTGRSASPPDDPYMPCPIYINNEPAVAAELLQQNGASTDVSQASSRLPSQEGAALHDVIWQAIAHTSPNRAPYAQQAKRHLPIWQEIWGRSATGKQQ